MTRWINAFARLAVAAAVGLVVVGCASPGTSQAPSAPPPAPTAASSAAPSEAPPRPTPTAATSLAEPPPASLAVDGGDSVTGSLGSFTWADGGSDSPWLPGAPIAVAAGEPLIVTLSTPVAVAEWTAKRVAAGTSDGTGAVPLAGGQGTPISFPAPGAGSWSVQVDVTFGDDLGSAAYYWAVTVQ